MHNTLTIKISLYLPLFFQNEQSHSINEQHDHIKDKIKISNLSVM